MNIKKDVCLITVKSNTFYYKHAIDNEYMVYDAYVSNNIVIKVIRFIIAQFNLALPKCILGRWVMSMDHINSVIVVDSYLTVPIVKYINKHHPSVRVIVWYWNPISNSCTVRPEEYRKFKCELWSFDQNDCEKYGMAYNTQYYDKKCDVSDLPQKYDIVFIGSDKGRSNYLLRLKKQWEQAGLIVKMCIVADKNTPNDNRQFCCQPIKYEDYEKMIIESGCILDINQNNQVGITLRPLEALCFKKKLITNNKGIRKEFLYSSDNVMVLDELEKDVYSFVKSPYNDSNVDSLIKYYSFETWICRFFE